MLKAEDFLFEEIEESLVLTKYSDGCSGNRSDCCTRVCTRNNQVATEEEWGAFLEVNSGVVQY
ncbi:hypothetical protein EKG37_20610 [Robertmurraya yapensis]|uniref:Uncharacterized protein n=1 Tax=Bacillus yapensis TaxID=2492960 RepID=A0A3S0I3P8_9BACI|nr:hypothetical protein [Bacillus yapensis]RTR26712.1 hypothetical protein EKG37_20610 [Bacillus yapensis]TKS93800.1 hypothetical protein FAR12_20615 [Bacillus yapensis]